MKKHNCILILVGAALWLALFVVSGNANEEYAAATGSECSVCHIDPLGGGELTPTGKGYLLSVAPSPEQGTNASGGVRRFIRLLVGYIHVITAFMWFGTILYVHLVLKPAYASMGLPKGEVKVGLASMAIMAITGMILTYDKVPTFQILLTSRFGILLLVKIGIFLIMVLSALYVILCIGPKLKKKIISSPVSGEFTHAQLQNFDGGDGRAAYFAYKGMIYDVTDSKLWREGEHMKRHHAGVDLTEVLAQAPHSEEKILALPVVGKLSETAGGIPGEGHKKVFYFMAYMNLGFVFVITLILALWRWY